MPKLWCSVPSDAQDVESLRVIRNSCREFMTSMTDEISPEVQAKWWVGSPIFRGTPLLFHLLTEPNPIGFGLLRVQGVMWLTGGLLPRFRGVGYGAPLFKTLIALSLGSGLEPWLRVRSDNERAIKLYRSLNFSAERQSRVIVELGAEKFEQITMKYMQSWSCAV